MVEICFFYSTRSGCLIWEVFNGPLRAMDNLANLGDIPKPLCPVYKVAFSIYLMLSKHYTHKHKKFEKLLQL